jgi:hypothetical protein
MTSVETLELVPPETIDICIDNILVDLSVYSEIRLQRTLPVEIASQPQERLEHCHPLLD